MEGTDGTARYRLLETLRAYGQERLSEQGEADAVAARHAGYYVSLAEAEEPVLWTFEKEMIPALHRLDAETENLAAVMRWSLARGQPEVAMRIGGAVGLWTTSRPHFAQDVEWLRRALAQGEGVAPLYRAKALDVITGFAQWWGRGDEAVATAQAELELARAAGEGRWVAAAMLSMAAAAVTIGDYDRARVYWREGAELARQYDERVLDVFASLDLTRSEPPTRRHALLEELLPQAPYVLQSRVHLLLALAARALGDLERALAHAQQSLAGWTEMGQMGMQGGLLVHLAEIAAWHGDHEGAELLLERGRNLSRQLGHYGQVIWAMREMGLLAWQQGDLEKACSRFRECLDLAHEHQYNQEAALARTGLALVSCERGEYDQAGALCEQARPGLPYWGGDWQAFALYAQGRIALGRGQAARAIEWYRAALAYLRPGESRPDMVEVLEYLAWALAADGQHEEAARLLAFAERERVEMGIVLPPVDRPPHERALHAVRAALDETAFAAAWAAGQALDMEGAVALALPDARGSGR